MCARTPRWPRARRLQLISKGAERTEAVHRTWAGECERPQLAAVRLCLLPGSRLGGATPTALAARVTVALLRWFTLLAARADTCDDPAGYFNTERSGAAHGAASLSKITTRSSGRSIVSTEQVGAALCDHTCNDLQPRGAEQRRGDGAGSVLDPCGQSTWTCREGQRWPARQLVGRPQRSPVRSYYLIAAPSHALRCVWSSSVPFSAA